MANLRGANLSRANLYGANLRGANLSEADLYGAKLYGTEGRVLAIGPIGSRCGITYAVRTSVGIEVQCGCYRGPLEIWEARCREVHGDSPHGKAYSAAAAFIRAYAAAYWESEEE